MAPGQVALDAAPSGAPLGSSCASRKARP